MKRWSLLVLLVLLPFTLAPRTSLNDGATEIALNGVVSRTSIRPGTTATLVVQARNITDSVLERAEVDVAVRWDGKSDALRLGASPFCSVDPTAEVTNVSCRLGDLQPGEQRTLRVSARPSLPGVIVFDTSAGSALGPQPADRPIEVTVRGR